MNLRPINATTLADTLAGQCPNPFGQDVIRSFLGEIEHEPRLREMYWFVQAISRRADGCRAFSSNASGRPDLQTQSNFDETLKFLAGQECNYRAGKCPAGIREFIFKQMERHAAAVRFTLADTKVSATILKELDLALHHKVPVPIIGDSRFGKTKALSVWCESRLGKVRLVTVPESNRDWDFFAAHADAFGIAYTDRTPLPRLKRAVEWVLRQSGFFVCYDEAHFLVPVGYYKDSAPKRINWVRCQVIDKGIGCAFFATPQNMNQTLERYAAKTKYNFEQWLGRLAPPVVLADYYDRDELMAVARVHFPDFPEKLLALICARAMQSEGYLKSMEFAARYAAALAQDRTNKTPNLQDVEAAIQRMMPSKAAVPATTAPAARRRIATPLQPDCRPVAEQVNADGDSEQFTSRNRITAPGADQPRAGRALVAA